MDQPIRGVSIDFNAMHGKGWYVVPKGGFPSGLACQLCDHAVRVGEIVLAWTTKCAPLAAMDTRHTHMHAIHKDCLVGALESAPEDNYETIRERVRAGGPLWTE